MFSSVKRYRSYFRQSTTMTTTEKNYFCFTFVPKAEQFISVCGCEKCLSMRLKRVESAI